MDAVFPTVSYLWIWLCVFADSTADAATVHLVVRQASNFSSLEEDPPLPAYASGLIVTGTVVLLFIGVLGIVLCCLCYRSGWLKCRRRHGRGYYDSTTESQVSLTRMKAPNVPPILPAVTPHNMTSLIVRDIPEFDSRPITYPISCADVISHSTTDGYDPLQSFRYRRGSDILSSDASLQVPHKECHDTSSQSMSSQSQECCGEVVAECMKFRQAAVALGRSLPLRRQQSISLPDLYPCSRVSSGTSLSKSRDFETGFLHPPTHLGLEQTPQSHNPDAQERLVHSAVTPHIILQEHSPREPKERRCGSLFSLTSQDSGASTNSAPPALTRHTFVDEKIPLVTPV